jgi:hypothetical protein
MAAASRRGELRMGPPPERSITRPLPMLTGKNGVMSERENPFPDK